MRLAENTAPDRAAYEQHFRTDHLLSNLKSRTIASGLVTAVSQGVQFVLTMGSTMVLARLLVPEDFGLVAMVYTVMGFFRVFKDAGLSVATVQREQITHAQVSNLFWINVGLSGLITLLVAASAPAIAWFYREPRLIGITLSMAITFLLAGATVQHMALLNRQMRFLAIAGIQLGAMLVGVLVAFAMAWGNCGYWSLVGSNVATTFMTCLLTIFLSGWRPQWWTRGSGTRPLLSFGANLATAGFTWSMARATDLLLIGRVWGADAAGLYSRANALLMGPVGQIMSPVETVIIPALARLQLQPERYRRNFLQAYEVLALGTVALASLFLALAHPVTLLVLGPKWEMAAPIFAAFTFCAIVYPLVCAACWLFASQGRGRDWLVATSIISTFTVLAFVVGLPFGPLGVAIAYSISGLLIQLPVTYYLGGRSGPVSTRDLWIGLIRYLPVWGVIFGATWPAHKLLQDFAPWLQLSICLPVGLVFGFACIWVYSPARRTVLHLLVLLREWKNARSPAQP